jgi:thioredoxin:protein disulfide reductase
MNRLWLFILLQAGFIFPAIAAGSSADVVKPEIRLSADKVVAGGTIKIAVIIKIAEGWHVNAHVPSADYLVGTEFVLVQREGMIVADIQYPQGRETKLSVADQPLSVYQGSPAIFMTLRFSEKYPLGIDTIRGTLEVQACNDQVCLPPASILVSIPVTVDNGSTSARTLDTDLFSSYKPGRQTLPQSGSNEIGNIFESKGSLVAFLAIFLVGLALNLTPCVYPMMSITVSLFGGQSDTNTFRVVIKAVTYVLGIATMYSVLGVTAALGGGLFGSWLQSSWVLGGIGLLLFGMALSSFGLYQIQMPYWLTSRLGGSSGTGIISLYLSGLVVGVFAAPCIGPPVIALLALVSAKADPVFGFWVFFTLSIGLGFPYLILGTFSGMIKKIPRSGTWLVWVERIFGVILTGAALFYLSLAVLPKYSVFVIPLTLLAGGVYLGFLEPSGKENTILRRVKWIVGTVAILGGLFSANALRQEGITWEKYSQAQLDEAKNKGIPVVLDFYADWCIPCIELERQTFTSKEVIAASERFVRLKVDLTRFDSPESEQLRKKYGIAGVPTIVFLTPQGEEAAASRVIGFLPPAEFLNRLNAVR